MGRTTQIYAHRGAKRVAPENTLPAFAQALAMGVAGIELDVQCSQDGVLFVLHNFTLDETTDGRGLLAEKTAAELKRLDAGSHFSQDFAGTPLPTLEEVFALVDGRCILNVEIKSREPLGGREVEPLVELIQAGNLYERVLVSSFNPITLLKLRWHEPRIPIGLLYAQEPLPQFLRVAWTTPIMQPEAYHPHHTLVDPAMIAWAREQSAAANTWTVNDVAEAERLAALGVDVIMTDVPDRLLAALA